MIPWFLSPVHDRVSAESYVPPFAKIWFVLQPTPATECQLMIKAAVFALSSPLQTYNHYPNHKSKSPAAKT